MSDSSNKNGLILFFVALLVIGGIIFFAMQEKPSTNNTQIIDGWMATTTAGVSFQYPPTLDAKYISLAEWPPQVKIIDEPFSCTEAGNTVDRGGATQSRTINGTQYCVVTSSEGAAGSTYTNYVFAFAPNKSTSTVALVIFTLKYPQCLNYDEPLQTACKTEQDSFNVDTLADRMARTLVVN
jgi:hypothetical protein